MHDIFAEPFFTPKEFLANPKQIAHRLLGQRNAWANAGMNEEKISGTEAQPQIVRNSRCSVGIARIKSRNIDTDSSRFRSGGASP